MSGHMYSAFISYRHTMPDEAVAKRLHTLIENYSIPSRVKKASGRARMGRVFRDQEELPLSTDLGADIRSALDNSEWLIVLCSPQYLQSMWCKAELDYFISLGRRDHILAVLVDGEPNQAFPQQLCYAVIDGKLTAVEPLAGDVRGRSVSESLHKLKQEKLRLLAPMLGVSFDTLRQRARRRRNRIIAAAATVGFAVLAGFLTYALVKNSQIAEQRDIAVDNQMQLLIEEANVATKAGNKLPALKMLNQAATMREVVGEGNDAMLKTAMEYTLYDSPFNTILTIDNDNRRFTSMEFSHDDRYLIGITNLNSACLIDAVEGKLLYTVSRSDFGQLDSVGFTADDRYFYMVDSWNNFVSLYDTATGELFRQYNVQSEFTWQIGEKVFPMSGGRMLIVRPQKLSIWDYVNDTAQDILPLQETNPLIGYTQPLIVALSPDERYVAVASHGYGHGMQVVCLDDMRTTNLDREQERGYSNIVFSGDGRYLSAVSGQQYCVWDASNGRCILKELFDDNNGHLDYAVINYDGSVLLVTSSNYLGAVDVRTKRLLWEQTTDSNVVTEAVISPNGKYVGAAGGIEGVFDLSTGEKLSDRAVTGFSSDTTRVICDAYSSKPSLLATYEASTQRRVEHFDTPLYQAPRYTKTPSNIGLNLSHNVGDFYRTGEGSVGRESRLFNSTDLHYAAFKHEDGFIEVFDISDLDHPAEINCVAEHCFNNVTDITFNGNLMASCGGFDARCALFDLEKGQIRHVLKGEDFVQSCEFSKDGSKIILLCGKSSETALVYAVDTGNLLYRFTAPEGEYFKQVGFSENGSLVAAVTGKGNAVTGVLYSTLDDLIREAGNR